MFKTFFIPLLLLATSVFFFHSCEKDDDQDPQPETGNVDLQMTYVFGSAQLPFALGTQVVQPKTGDTLTFQTFKYYVSNVRLKNSNNEWVSIPNSYYLLDATSEAGSKIGLTGLATGTYTEIEILFGVDSTKNVSGAQAGDLSPAFGMLWDWNSGYIMLKAEGLSPQSNDGSFTFHLGGFSGENSVLMTRNFDLSANPIIVSKGTTGKVFFKVNPARLWHTAPSVSTTSVIHMPGAMAKTMAQDLYSNVSVDRVEN